MRGSKSAGGVGTKEGRESGQSPENAEPDQARKTQIRTKAANARTPRDVSRGSAPMRSGELLLLLLGLVWFGEAVHDAFELHRGGVRGGAPRRTGEGERMLRTWIGDVHHDDLARLQLREQDLLGQQILDVTLDRPP